MISVLFGGSKCKCFFSILLITSWIVNTLWPVLLHAFLSCIHVFLSTIKYKATDSTTITLCLYVWEAANVVFCRQTCSPTSTRTSSWLEATLCFRASESDWRQSCDHSPPPTSPCQSCSPKSKFSSTSLRLSVLFTLSILHYIFFYIFFSFHSLVRFRANKQPG